MVSLSEYLTSSLYIFNCSVNLKDSSPKDENCLFTHPCSKPVWVCFFCWAQKNVFWRMLVTKQLLVAVDFFSLHTMEVNGYWQLLLSQHSSKYHLLTFVFCLLGCVPLCFFMPFPHLCPFVSLTDGCTPLLTLHKCLLPVEPMQWVELEHHKPLITWNLLWSWFIIYITVLYVYMYVCAVTVIDNKLCMSQSCRVVVYGAAWSVYINRLASSVKIEGSRVCPYKLPSSTWPSGTRIKMAAEISSRGSA